MTKSNTDLKQSRKLTEILPLESADMWWLYITAQGKHIAMMQDEPDPYYLTRMESYGIKNAAIPCWSLAALFDTLPKTIGDYSKTMGYFDNAYHCDYFDEDGEGIGFGTTADNLVDAVYEMVLILQNKPNK